MAVIDPRMDPESAKRLASGIWNRQYDPLADMETWTCDKRKLNDKIAEAMTDPEFAQRFTQGGMRLLDRIFGEGTAEAFRYKSNERVCMRFDPFRDTQRLSMDLGRKDAIARGTTSTATNEFFTTASAGQTFVRDEMKRQVKDVAKTYVAPARKLIRNIPFKIECGGSLLSSLQREFDHWAGDQMKLVNS